MPLTAPILDDRSYAQLRDELVARIPVYTPEWTDHHASDPGITLLELFSFLGENLLFRFNQIPDATLLAFLRLLQIPMHPAVPASGLVQFQPDDPIAGPVVDIDTQVRAGDVSFRVMQEVTVWPLEARAAIREAVSGELAADVKEYVERARAALGAVEEEPDHYRTAFGAPDPTGASTEPLRPSAAIDGSLYVGLVLPAADTPVPTGLAGGLLSIGITPAQQVPTIAEVDACPGEGARAPSPEMQWQVGTVTPRADATDAATADPVWLNLEVVGDTTAGLTRTGVVRLRLPEDLSQVGVYLPADPDAHGAGDSPPLIEDEELFARMLAWLRVFRPGPDGVVPDVQSVTANATMAEQAVRSQAELVGVGTGEPGQSYRLVHPGVLGTVSLDVEDPATGRWEPWTQVDHLDDSGPDDRVFVVDREAGVVSFGGPRRGHPPQIGRRIRTRTYRYGGGAAGNVGAGAVTKVPSVAGVSVTNFLPLDGGADAETLPEAMQRIPQEFRRHDRAVTVSDFAELARATPGAGIVRADTLRLFHPASPTEIVPGAVSVVVWPAVDRTNPGAPRPTRDTLQRVCRHLDERRLVTTEVHIIPPTYVKVALSVGIEVKAGHGIEAVRRWVELVLRQYLAPVPPYGPEGQGWPLDRDVLGPELEAAALQVEGLKFLQGLRVATQNAALEWEEQTAPRTIPMRAWEVPEVAEITVVDGAPLAPGDTLSAPLPTGPPIPVREPQEVCG